MAAIDPHAGYRKALVSSLPRTAITVDVCHAVKLAHAAVDDVRRRVQRETLGHRGRNEDPLYGIRRLPIRSYERPSDKQQVRITEALRRGDPYDEVGGVGRQGTAPLAPNARSTIGVLKGRLRKLLDLYYSDSISAATFTSEEKRLIAQIASLEDEAARLEEQAREKVRAAERFDQVSELLASLDFDAIWERATETERRTLVEDLVDSVHIYPDHLTVQVAGAPPIVVTLAEVGLRAGTKPVVSEGGLEPPRPFGH